MCTTTAFGRQIPRKCSRGRLHGLANVVDDPLDQRRIIALGHHPDQRLGAGFANDEATLAFQLGFSGGDALANAVGLERLAAAIEADVLEQLGKRLELPEELARRGLGLDQGGEHLEPGDQPVAGGRDRDVQPWPGTEAG